MKFLVLHGPNLNLLGVREPDIYGATTLKEIDTKLHALAVANKQTLTTFQSNAEHVLIEQLHSAKQSAVDFIIINPGAFTHTSIALRDAFLATALPFIEVHISNIFAREDFRKHSYLSDIAIAVISGLGAYGYEVALLNAVHHFQK